LGKLLETKEDIRIDAVYGFHRITDSKERIGFLLNMHTVNKIKLEEETLITFYVVVVLESLLQYF